MKGSSDAPQRGWDPLRAAASAYKEWHRRCLIQLRVEAFTVKQANALAQFTGAVPPGS